MNVQHHGGAYSEMKEANKIMGRIEEGERFMLFARPPLP